MKECKRKFRRQGFLLWRPVGEPGESIDWEFLEMVGGLRKRSISFCGSSSLGIRKEGSGDGHYSLVRGPFTRDSED
jgi:hypothetical protein